MKKVILVASIVLVFMASTASAASTAYKRISGDGHFGCLNKRDFVKLTNSYAVIGEGSVTKDTVRGILNGAIAVGACTMFKEGELVFVTDAAFYSGLIKVRRKGEVSEYWIQYGAIWDEGTPVQVQ